MSPARRFPTAEFAIPVLAAVVALQVRVVILLERESGLEGIKSFKQFINQCFLVSLSVDINLHLRQDSQQDCPKVLV